jgi:hypothetical protein
VQVKVEFAFKIKFEASHLLPSSVAAKNMPKLSPFTKKCNPLADTLPIELA